MRGDSLERVHDWLLSRIETLDHGDRLPTVRALMRQHGAGQATVQGAYEKLRKVGLVTAEVGRGTFVVKPGAHRAPAGPEPESRLGSLLVLSNSSMNERGARVQNHIVEDVRADGGRVVQLSFHDSGHLMDLLRRVPDFDAAILQSHYEVVPLKLLALLQAKTRAVVVDGHSISGVDIDRVGIDWEETLCSVMDHLAGLGHRRITLITLDTLAQPLVQAQRFFRRLTDWRGQPVALDCVALPDLRHPSQPVARGLAAALPEIRRNSPTAVIFIGVSDGLGIRDTMAAAGIGVPQDLSVAIMGHPDVPTEHLGQFTIFGGTGAEAAEQLLSMIRRRLTNPGTLPESRYLKVVSTPQESTSPPGRRPEPVENPG